MTRNGVALVCMMVSASSPAAPSPWLNAQTEGLHEVQGTFRQVDYGFAISPPPSATEYVTNGGGGEHGVLFVLGEGRKIDVYPQYAGSDLGVEARPCSDNQLPSLNGQKTRRSTMLGSIAACIVTVVGRGRCWVLIQAVGDDRGQAILYSLFLTTTARFLTSDLRSLHLAAASFRRIRIQP